jgi:pimeloyl-ACP methyl ester carboxylesterase
MKARQPNREGAVRWRRTTVASVFDQLLPETHPTRQHEDAVGWALDTDTDTDTESMIAARDGRYAPAGADAESLCPTLVVHGTEDRCQPLAPGRRQAELTGGERGRAARLRGTYQTPGTRSRSSDSSPSSSSG